MTILDVDGLYTALGVAFDASPEAIRLAYRQQSKIWHPDVNNAPNAADQMALINEAFRVLSDPIQRYDYDRKKPPAPTITCSSYDIELNKRVKKVVVTVSSSAPIGSVDVPNPFGLGWTAMVQLKDINTVEIVFTRDPNGVTGNSYLDFSVDDVPQSIRVSVLPARTATTTASSRQSLSGNLVSSLLTILQCLMYVAVVGGLGFLSGFIGKAAMDLGDALQVKDAAASRSMLLILAAVAIAAVLYIFCYRIVVPRWTVDGSFTQTVAIAGFVVMMNIAWPTAVAILILLWFAHRVVKYWVRL